MKVTEPIDVYLADKLFQLTGTAAPLGQRRGLRRGARRARPWWSSAAATASAPTSPAWPVSTARPCTPSAARGTGTHVERRSDVAAAAATVLSRDRPDRLRGRHRRGAAPWRAARDLARRPSTRPPRSTTSRPIFIAQEFQPAPARDPGVRCCSSPPAPTPGAARGYSLYSSAKAATVNLTQALADEWAEDGVRVNCINPERTATPMRVKAFGEEPAGLLGSEVVAKASLDVLLSKPDRPRRRHPQGRPAPVRPRRPHRPGALTRRPTPCPSPRS